MCCISLKVNYNEIKKIAKNAFIILFVSLTLQDSPPILANSKAARLLHPCPR
jgi:hypothetical protein